MRTGAEAKQLLRCFKAASASGDHRKGVEVRAVSGAAM